MPCSSSVRPQTGVHRQRPWDRGLPSELALARGPGERVAALPCDRTAIAQCVHLRLKAKALGTPGHLRGRTRYSPTLVQKGLSGAQETQQGLTSRRGLTPPPGTSPLCSSPLWQVQDLLPAAMPVVSSPNDCFLCSFPPFLIHLTLFYTSIPAACVFIAMDRQ